ncbi:tRNA 2'-phosphotransferase [Rhinocladiella similis]
MDHLLAWQRLKSMQPRVSFDEVIDVVLENEKKRFALKYVGGDGDGDGQDGHDQEQGQGQGQEQEQQEQEQEQVDNTETDTKRAISKYEMLKNQGGWGGGQLDTSLHVQRFFIRATQGHSMDTVEAENLLTPITLDDPSSIPETVVHGTFYGAWDAIMASGGLEKMSRNHVHFATGPRFQDVMARIGTSTSTSTSTGTSKADHGVTNDSDTRDGTTDDGGDRDKDKGKGKSKSKSKSEEEEEDEEEEDNHPATTDADAKGSGKSKDKGKGGGISEVLGKNKVISGMRSDAQILVYVDIRRALVEQPDMKWWRSENGVILTDGVAVTTTTTTTDTAAAANGGDDAAAAAAAANAQDQAAQGDNSSNKVVPTSYFSAAVEIKEGVGLLYESGRGVVTPLPERLRSRGVPRGKGGRGRGGGGGRGGRGRGRG